MKTKEQGTAEVKAVRAWTTVGNDNNISLHRLYDNKPNFTVNEERHIEVEIRPVSQLSEPTDAELLTCPFCGQAPKYSEPSKICNMNFHLIQCTKCLFHISDYDSKEYLFIKWNRRAPLSEPTDDELFEFMSNGEMRNIKWNIDNGYYECRERCKIIGEGLTAREAVLAAYNEEKGKRA